MKDTGDTDIKVIGYIKEVTSYSSFLVAGVLAYFFSKKE
jgi:hypothetical protein